MTIKIAIDIKKLKFGRKIPSEVYLLLPLYENWNRFITKKFPIEALLEMIDSSVRSRGEVEYDKQNCLQHQKTRVWLIYSKWVLPPIATVHKLVHNKKFSN